MQVCIRNVNFGLQTMTGDEQWLKCIGTQGNGIPPPPIYGLKHSPTSDCYTARERHTAIVRGPNLNVVFPHL